MKRIILNHLRRWWWLWLVIGVANCFMTGAFLNDGHSAIGLNFQLVLWLGAMQLNFDLQRGNSRVLSTLPVTARQIGRAWWIFSVALPALFLAATSGFAMLLDSAVRAKGFPTNYFALNAIANLLFLGAMFSLFVGEVPGWPHNVFGWLRRIFSVGIVVGMIFYLQSTFDSLEGMLILLTALILTVIGWFRAEQMVLQRATFKLGVQPGKRQPGRHQAQPGFGGLPFLWQTLAIRLGYMALAVVGWFLIMHLVMHGAQKLSPKQLMAATLPAFSSFGFFFIFIVLLLPMVMQLRHLRTLPISTASLAALLVLLPTMPVCIVGVVWAAIGGDIVHISSSFLTYAAVMSIGAPLFVWQGMRMGSYLLLMVLLMISALAPILFPTTKIAPSITMLISLAIIILAVEITRRLLKSSSQAYRPPAANMTGWGGWR